MVTRSGAACFKYPTLEIAAENVNGLVNTKMRPETRAGAVGRRAVPRHSSHRIAA